MKNFPDGIPMSFVLLAGAVFVMVTLGGLILLAWARNADARAVRRFAAVPLTLGALAIGLVLVLLFATQWIFGSASRQTTPSPAASETNQAPQR
jgi:ABC-type dipeptide/oligopeptide/nickel transport system permease component